MSNTEQPKPAGEPTPEPAPAREPEPLIRWDRVADVDVGPELRRVIEEAHSQR